MSTFTDYVAEHPDLVQQSQDFFKTVMERSAQDMDFRARLLEDPKEALAEYGQGNWDNLNIRFIENEADATIVLPDPVSPEAELSEAELEVVSGGSTPGCYLVISLIVGVTIS